MESREIRYPLCREILIPEDDDTIVNAQGLMFDQECWAGVVKAAEAEGIDPNKIIEATVDEKVENIILKLIKDRR